jgi:glycosyltransferase involved in cell wall biosynthesis
VRVAINTRLLIENKIDGIGRFAFETLKVLTRNNPKVEFHFIFDRPFSSNFIFSNNIIPHILSPPTRHPLLWYIWFEFQLPRLLKKINADIFFSPDGFIPTNCQIPTVTAIHDINFEHNPNSLPFLHSLFYRTFFKKYAKLGDEIITVSNFSKEDIAKTYNINPKKIHVIYNGVSNLFRTISNDEKNLIKKKYSSGTDFFMFIGSLHKRKNMKNLLLSFEEYKKANGKLKLLVVGETKWTDQEVKNIYHNMIFKEDVILLGRINDEQLADILASAHALCFISMFEGFGLPIVEAMKCSVPVITSNTSCMPEIAQDSAIIIDPNNIDEIKNAMSQIETDKLTRTELIKKGNLRVKNFDWEVSGNKIWEIIKKAHHK